MIRRPRHTAPALVLAGLATLVAAPVRVQAQATAATALTSRYGDVSWSELAYSAHKFFLGASTTIRVERVPVAAVADALPATSGRPVIPIPAKGAAAVTVDTTLPFGRDETVRLFFDPSSGAALGGEKTTLGRSAYHKSLRYTEGGLITWRTAPATTREAALPPTAWTQQKWSVVEPAIAPPAGTPVTDSYALIYLVSAAHLDQPGQSSRILMLADDRFVELAFVAGVLAYHRVDFRESWPGGGRRRQGDVLVRKVAVTAQALGARESNEDVELGFLGMRGSLTVYLEAGTDLPVALSGRAAHVGEITVRLERAVLTAAPPAEQ